MTGRICPSLYSEYTAGTMDEGLALLVASFLSYCPDARAHVGNCTKVAGAMLETLSDPVGMKEHSLQNVLMRLDEEEKCPGFEDFMLAEDLALPAPLCAFLCTQGQVLKWRKMGRGGRFAVLPRPSCGTRIAVFDIAPGGKLPPHKHKGVELTLILRGAYQDEEGYHNEGTLHCNNEDSAPHTPSADTQRGCLCITATQGLQFTGPFAPILNLFWK